MRKLLQKKLLSFISTNWGIGICIIGVIITFNTLLQLSAIFFHGSNNPFRSVSHESTGKCTSEPIDIVYTWVNGTDPKHMQEMEEIKLQVDPKSEIICNGTKKQNQKCYEDVASKSRFVDNEELRYSLRSIEKFAPWVRHIYIVTNGQIPYWLDLSHPHLTVVTHNEIFINKSHLPTYSSPAIEAHLHRIPNLSNKFIYLNDDVMFGTEIWPDDFYTNANGAKVFLAWNVPNCNEGCPSNWIGDKYCDQACNVSQCDWDGGDCANATSSGRYSWNNNNNAPTYPSSQTYMTSNYCSRSCPDSWVGDKYCDWTCKNLECGYDAGDCGVEIIFENMFGADINNETSLIFVPSGVQSMYFNLTHLVGDGKIVDGSHDNSQLVRTATISQKSKVMTLTFHHNISRQNVSILVAFTINNTRTEKSFNISACSIRNTTTVHTNTTNGHLNTSLTNSTHSSVSIQPGSSVVQPGDSPPLGNGTLTEIRRENNESSHSSGTSDPRQSASLVNANLQNTPQNIDRNATLEISINNNNTNSANTTITHQTDITNDTNVNIRNGNEKENNTNSTENNQPNGTLTRKLLSIDELFPSKHHPIVISSEEPNLLIQELEKQLLLTREADLERFLRMRDEKFRYLQEQQALKLAARRPLPLEEEEVYPWEVEYLDPVEHDFNASLATRRRLLDTFGDSLKYVDRLYTKAFGNSARKVPAHMPHMIDKNIFAEMQNRWLNEWAVTSSHKFRSSNDMQFAFSYFYYVMHVKIPFEPQLVWSKHLDVDGDGELNANELRTLAVKLFGTPLENAQIQTLRNDLLNCSKTQRFDYDTVMNCQKINKQLVRSFSSHNKYKYEVMGTDDVAFLMIKTNATSTEKSLDGIREKSKKFVCLNDNMNHSDAESKKVVQALQNFYKSLFPHKSSFELPDGVVNEYLYIDEFKAMQRQAKQRRVALWIVFIVALVSASFIFKEMRNTQNTAKQKEQERERQQERETKQKRYQRLLNV